MKNNKYIIGADTYDSNSNSNGSLHVFIPNKIPLPKEPKPISTLYKNNNPIKKV